MYKYDTSSSPTCPEGCTVNMERQESVDVPPGSTAAINPRYADSPSIRELEKTKSLPDLSKIVAKTEDNERNVDESFATCNKSQSEIALDDIISHADITQTLDDDSVFIPLRTRALRKKQFAIKEVDVTREFANFNIHRSIFYIKKCLVLIEEIDDILSTRRGSLMNADVNRYLERKKGHTEKFNADFPIRFQEPLTRHFETIPDCTTRDNKTNGLNRFSRLYKMAFEGLSACKTHLPFTYGRTCHRRLSDFLKCICAICDGNKAYFQNGLNNEIQTDHLKTEAAKLRQILEINYLSPFSNSNSHRSIITPVKINFMPTSDLRNQPTFTSTPLEGHQGLVNRHNFASALDQALVSNRTVKPRCMIRVGRCQDENGSMSVQPNPDRRIFEGPPPSISRVAYDTRHYNPTIAHFSNNNPIRNFEEKEEVCSRIEKAIFGVGYNKPFENHKSSMVYMRDEELIRAAVKRSFKRAPTCGERRRLEVLVAPGHKLICTQKASIPPKGAEGSPEFSENSHDIPLEQALDENLAVAQSNGTAVEDAHEDIAIDDLRDNAADIVKKSSQELLRTAVSRRQTAKTSRRGKNRRVEILVAPGERLLCTQRTNIQQEEAESSSEVFQTAENIAVEGAHENIGDNNIKKYPTALLNKSFQELLKAAIGRSPKDRQTTGPLGRNKSCRDEIVVSPGERLFVAQDPNIQPMKADSSSEFFESADDIPQINANTAIAAKEAHVEIVDDEHGDNSAASVNRSSQEISEVAVRHSPKKRQITGASRCRKSRRVEIFVAPGERLLCTPNASETGSPSEFFETAEDVTPRHLLNEGLSIKQSNGNDAIAGEKPHEDIAVDALGDHIADIDNRPSQEIFEEATDHSFEILNTTRASELVENPVAPEEVDSSSEFFESAEDITLRQSPNKSLYITPNNGNAAIAADNVHEDIVDGSLGESPAAIVNRRPREFFESLVSRSSKKRQTTRASRRSRNRRVEILVAPGERILCTPRINIEPPETEGSSGLSETTEHITPGQLLDSSLAIAQSDDIDTIETEKACGEISDGDHGDNLTAVYRSSQGILGEAVERSFEKPHTTRTSRSVEILVAPGERILCTSRMNINPQEVESSLGLFETTEEMSPGQLLDGSLANTQRNDTTVIESEGAHHEIADEPAVDRSFKKSHTTRTSRSVEILVAPGERILCTSRMNIKPQKVESSMGLFETTQEMSHGQLLDGSLANTQRNDTTAIEAEEGHHEIADEPAVDRSFENLLSTRTSGSVEILVAPGERILCTSRMNIRPQKVESSLGLFETTEEMSRGQLLDGSLANTQRNDTKAIEAKRAHHEIADKPAVDRSFEKPHTPRTSGSVEILVAPGERILWTSRINIKPQKESALGLFETTQEMSHGQILDGEQRNDTTAIEAEGAHHVIADESAVGRSFEEPHTTRASSSVEILVAPVERILCTSRMNIVPQKVKIPSGLAKTTEDMSPRQLLDGSLANTQRNDTTAIEADGAHHEIADEPAVDRIFAKHTTNATRGSMSRRIGVLVAPRERVLCTPRINIEPQETESPPGLSQTTEDIAAGQLLERSLDITQINSTDANEGVEAREEIADDDRGEHSAASVNRSFQGMFETAVDRSFEETNTPSSSRHGTRATNIQPMEAGCSSGTTHVILPGPTQNNSIAASAAEEAPGGITDDQLGYETKKKRTDLHNKVLQAQRLLNICDGILGDILKETARNPETLKAMASRVVNSRP